MGVSRPWDFDLRFLNIFDIEMVAKCHFSASIFYSICLASLYMSWKIASIMEWWTDLGFFFKKSCSFEWSILKIWKNMIIFHLTQWPRSRNNWHWYQTKLWCKKTALLGFFIISTGQRKFVHRWVLSSNRLKDILDKIIFGYLCQIITPSAFYQYIACISLKVSLYGLVIYRPSMWV